MQPVRPADSPLTLQPPRGAAGRVRALIFTNCWSQAAGIPCSGAALRASGEALWPSPVQDAGGDELELNLKWWTYPHGVLVSGALRAALCRKYPALLMVLANPLWAVLRDLQALARAPHAGGMLASPASPGAPSSLASEPIRRRTRRRRRHQLDALAKQLRLDEQSLGAHSLEWLQQLITFHGSWTCLALLLAILVSRASCYAVPRRWLRQRFALTFLLMCLAPELRGVTSLLYPLIDDLMRAGVLWPVHDWPPNLAAFEQRLTALRRLSQQLQRQRRLPRAKADDWLRRMFNDLDGRRPCVSDLDLNLSDSTVDFTSVALQPLFRRCRRQQRRARDVVYRFARMPLDPKVYQGWERLQARDLATPLAAPAAPGRATAVSSERLPRERAPGVPRRSG